MSKKHLIQESELAALAKGFRLQSGKKKADVARELGVGRAAIQLAEEHPEQSLTRIRIRMIEAYSPFKVIGPTYSLRKK